MAYDTFSTHAQTGQSATTVVSSNPYTTRGRTIGYPNNLDLFVRHISDTDGSQSVQELRKVADLVGSRLYLHHRPLLNTDGTVTTITVSNGVLDTTYTNGSQGYVVFSTLPTVDFTVSYVAVPDCDVSWAINTLQDSVMEIEGVLGHSNSPSYPGIRNLKIGIFDSPLDAVASGVLQNSVALPHLNQNIVIGSSNDPTLQLLRGTAHSIQLGRETDNVIIDATGFTIMQSNGTKVNKIVLGSKTGDTISYKGTMSGAGPLIVGGPEWPLYSGVVFSTALTGSFYSGSMLRVHGDASFMGNVKAYGNITVVNSTGTTSTVMGDWTVRDELFVDGQSHLAGTVNTNTIIASQNLYLKQDLIAQNVNGQGGNGQTLIDGLDCSEVAWSYSTAIKSRHGNSVISAPLHTGAVAPKKVTYRPWMSIGPSRLVGDVFSITGQLNAAASSSGVHPHILQLLLNEEIVSGQHTGTMGGPNGVWSKGMMDPGAMWVRMLDGQAAGFNAPIYGHTVEGTTGTAINRLNVFIPESISAPPQTNNKYILYNPLSAQYNTVSAVGGATPTFSINASESEPLALSFEDSIRVLKSNSASISMKTALEYSVSGLGGSPVTGIAYIFADSTNTDPESTPVFRARATPIRMKGQTAVGEVVAAYDGATWSILESISYRPNGIYDSNWIPIYGQYTGLVSGRATPGFSSSSADTMKVYFHHYLGADTDIGRISADLYLANRHTGSVSWNQTHTPMYSMFGQDVRAGHGLSGTFFHIPLGTQRASSTSNQRDASIFYLDSAIIGVDMTPALVGGFPVSGSSAITAPNYLRLVINKTV
jgi:cytoskeletal protein CcmA (bactofilin family)